MPIVNFTKKHNMTSKGIQCKCKGNNFINFIT